MTAANVTPLRPTPNMFRAYREAGYRHLVPVIPYDAPLPPDGPLDKAAKAGKDQRGKMPGIRYGAYWGGLRGWINREVSEQDLDDWHAMGASLGIVTGHGLVGIDADTTDEHLAAKIEQTIIKRFGTLPKRVGRAPKALYLIRTTTPEFDYRRIDFGGNADAGIAPERVELLGTGRQFVAEGIHPKTKQPYQWIGPRPKFDSIPTVDPAELDALLSDLQDILPRASIHENTSGHDVDQATLKGDPDHVQRAVEAIPNTSDLFPTRDDFIKFGHAIKAALPDHQDDGLAIYTEWALRWEQGENDPDLVALEWRKMKPPYRVGASWLYDLAEQHGKGEFSTADVWFDALPAPEPSPFDTAAAQEAAKTEATKAAAQERFVFQSFADIAYGPVAPANPPLIKGLLDAGTMSILYGDSNVGKTFVAMDMGFHIATGMRYCGMKVNRGLVIHVAAEGGTGAKNRILALKERYPEEAKEADFLLLASSVDLRSANGDTDILIQAIRGVCDERRKKFGNLSRIEAGRPGPNDGPALVVIDTLSRALAGGDENSPVDMGALVKHLDRIRAGLPGAHVMVIHHTGKDAARGARGHSLLRAAVDTELEVSDGVISITKQRDLPKAWSGAFKLDVHALGVDLDGDAITSCTVRHVAPVTRTADGKEVRARAATEEEAAVLDAVAAIIEASGETKKGAKTADIITFMQSREDKLSDKSARRRIERITARGWLEGATRGRWRLSDVGEMVHFGGNEDEETGGIFE